MTLKARNNYQQPEGKTAPRDEEILVRVENVSKKFCRSLKKSLWYGVQDIAQELNPFGRTRDNEARSTKHEGADLRTDEFWAVNDVSFELRRGECLGLIGHNGAGKTTLLKMLNGLIKPDAGTIEVKGRVGALIALGAGFNPILTGRENVYVNASILGLTKCQIDNRLDEIVDFAEIGEFIDAPVQSYSSGMQVRLGFAVASVLKPDVLLLDEVLAVGDVAFQAKCFNKLAELRREGVPFILVSHNMHLISRYCQKAIFMKRGQVVFNGAAEKGIAFYLSELDNSSPESNSGPNWLVANGSGRVMFTSASFLNSDGNLIDTIGAGQSLVFTVCFRCNQSPVNNPVFDVVIRCRGEVVYQAANKACGKQFGTLPSEGKFILRFGSLPMNHGPLDFYFCLQDGESGELFDWKRDLRLKVQSDVSQSGLMHLVSDWSVDALS